MADTPPTPTPTPAPEPGGFFSRWRVSLQLIIGWIVIVLGTLAVNWFFGTNFSPPQPPIWGKVAGDDYQFGWHHDPDAVKAVSETLRFKVFADTPAGQAQDPLPNQVFLWDAYRKIFNELPPCKNQKDVGSCVSFGTNNAIERTQAAAIAFNKQPFVFKPIVEEVTYGGSRVEIGGGRIRGDGSVGAWAATFVRQYGVLPRGKYTTNAGQSYDLTEYNTSRCREWGSKGVPDDLESSVKEFPVKGITQIPNWEQAKRALSQGYGIAICSNQGFSMQRNANGVASPKGNWGHCMCLDGYIVVNGKEYGHIENSWGADAHTGPTGWGNPSTAGFWADSSVIDKMLKQGDSWAFSDLTGFPRKRLDWFVLNQDATAPVVAHNQGVNHAIFEPFPNLRAGPRPRPVRRPAPFEHVPG